MKNTPIAMALVGASLLSGCAPDPDWANKAALEIGAPRAAAMQIRERQTTVMARTSEPELLVEATQVLQDLGFTIEESTSRFGVLAGSKDRDATEAGQIAGQVVLTIGLALLGVSHSPVYDTDQVIRATLTTKPVGEQDAQIRVSFERIVTNNKGLSRVEELTEAEYSSGFFDKVRAGLAAKG